MYLSETRIQKILPTELRGIPEGALGVKATLNVMRRLAREAASNPEFVQRVRAMVKSAAQKDWIGEINRVHEFVRDHIRYTRDPVGLEWVQTPQATLETGQGDCDDKSTLAAAMLRAIGHPSRFVAIGFAPGRYSHVFVETRVNRGKSGYHWVALETTEPWPLGKSPAGFVAKTIKDV